MLTSSTFLALIFPFSTALVMESMRLPVVSDVERIVLLGTAEHLDGSVQFLFSSDERIVLFYLVRNTLIFLLKGSPVCRNFAFVGGFQPLHKFARCVFLTERFHANKTLTVRRANGSVLALFIELDFVAAQPKQFPKIIERM